MTKPLDGVRVVDLSQITSGPFGTMILAEQGADVVKVETPGIGDLSRWTPDSRNGVSSFLLNQNRGKRSIAVDLEQRGGQGGGARPDGRCRRRGAELPTGGRRPPRASATTTCAGRNAGVIYASVSGFGPDGPYADRPVLDPGDPGAHGDRAPPAERGDPAPRPGPQHHGRQGHRAHPGPERVRRALPPHPHRRGRPHRDPDARHRPVLLLARRDDGHARFVGDGVDAGPRVVDLYQHHPLRRRSARLLRGDGLPA